MNILKEKPKVLIVDDRPGNLLMLEGIVGRLDATVVSVQSGADSLAAMAREEFAVVLVGVEMSEMDGFEVAAQMQHNNETTSIPVILVTAMDHDDRPMLRGYEAGAVDYIYKPINPYVFRAKVQIFLNLYERRKLLEDENRRMAALQRELTAKKTGPERGAPDAEGQSGEPERRGGARPRSNLELDSFARVVSRNLTRPLLSILDYLELLTSYSSEKLDTNAAGWVESSLRLGNRMRQKIADLLDYATVGAEDTPMEPASCEDALSDALTNLDAAIRESGAAVTHDALPEVHGSGKLLSRLFRNLISNSMKYRGEEPPRIHVAGEQRQSDWVLRVRDNGRGIREADLGRVLEMFLSTTDSTVSGGLGLAICQKIVAGHGGKIWVESELGRGSEFCFTLPLLGSEGEPSATDGREGPARSRSAKPRKRRPRRPTADLPA